MLVYIIYIGCKLGCLMFRTLVADISFLAGLVASLIASSMIFQREPTDDEINLDFAAHGVDFWFRDLSPKP